MGNTGGCVSWSRTNENGRVVVQVSGDYTPEELTELFRSVTNITKEGDIDAPVKVECNGVVPNQRPVPAVKAKAKK